MGWFTVNVLSILYLTTGIPGLLDRVSGYIRSDLPKLVDMATYNLTRSTQLVGS